MIKKFEFISKSSTLKKLKLELKQSRILPIYSFSINEWKNKKKNILTKIRKKFIEKKVSKKIFKHIEKLRLNYEKDLYGL